MMSANLRMYRTLGQEPSADSIAASAFVQYISEKNLPPDQQVLAELIFDKLQNGYEIWTAE